jgi:hypothetical protein
VSSVIGIPTNEAPWYILDTLAGAGWTLSITAGECGRGIRVRATRHHLITAAELEVEESGKDVAEVALVIAMRCARLTSGTPEMTA